MLLVDPTIACFSRTSSARSFDLQRALRCHGSSDFLRLSSALLRDFLIFVDATGLLWNPVRRPTSSLSPGYGSGLLLASASKQLLYKSDRIKRW